MPRVLTQPATVYLYRNRIPKLLGSLKEGSEARLNTTMDNKQQSTPTPPQSQPQPRRKPNEVGGIAVSGFVKIFDPNTKETILETRA